MSRRERVEDLGRIAEISSALLEFPFFEWESEDLKNKISSEDGMDQIISQIDHIRYKVDDIYEIARWGDNTRECDRED